MGFQTVELPDRFTALEGHATAEAKASDLLWGFCRPHVCVVAIWDAALMHVIASVAYGRVGKAEELKDYAERIEKRGGEVPPVSATG